MLNPHTAQKKLDPSMMFHDGFIYREAAVRIANQAPTQPAMFFPAASLFALSSEIFLKCLLAVKHKGLIPRKIQWNHHLRELFDELPHTHATIEKHWNAAIEKNELYKINDGPFRTKTDLKTCLTEGAKAFEKYRYVYEQSLVPFSLQPLPDVLVAAISELEPSVPRYPAVITDFAPFRVAIHADGKVHMAWKG
ncbi:hypothetical protein [Bradyrhizobium sp. F1.13.3]|uniref:hypothetical protein n=1 Tax=Bradyrhizobium sp. F1.13.3 TaxID=3156351 RepID=UPI003392B6E6